MATTIPELTDATSVNPTDELIVQQGNVTKRATVAELAAGLPTGTVIQGSSTTPALRVTQTGTGDALVVEDSANPDATPLVVNNVGQIISGATTAFNTSAGLQITADSADAPNASINIRRCSDTTSPSFIFTRTRGTGAVPTSVQPEDVIGRLQYSSFTGTGTASHAAIQAMADGAVSAANAPGRLTFDTTPSGSGSVVERMRIDSAGNVGIGTTANAAAILDVASTTKGFLAPRMTGAQRDGIASPPAGLMVYNTTTNKLNFYNGAAWEAVTSS